MFGKKGKTNAQGEVDLSQIIRGMQHAVNEAQRTLEVHHLKSLLRFFYEDGKPRTADFCLGGTRHMDVPLVSLANHEALRIEELEMAFKANIRNVTLKDMDELDALASKKGENLSGDEESGSAVFSVGFSDPDRESGTVSVKIRFVAAKQPEGLSRVIEEYDKMTTPYDVPVEPEAEEQQFKTPPRAAGDQAQDGDNT
jgi:hypothetical protein